ASSMCVAKLCLSVWGATCLAMPACFAASATAVQTIFSVMGTSARQLLTVPGNRYVFGFIQRQYSRRVPSSFGVNRTSRSRPPLPWQTCNDHAFAVDIADLEVA